MKIVNPLREQDTKWIENNLFIFTGVNRSISKEQVTDLFAILSWLTGKNQKPTGCGRCIASARDTIWSTYNKTQNND